MATLLEEIIRRKEKREPYIRLIVGMPINEAYYFEVSKRNAGEFFKNYFSLEALECKEEKKEKMDKTLCLEEPASCFYFRTDSSSIAADSQIFSKFIGPAAKSHSYDEDALKLCMGEAYINAVTHGNHAGEDVLYNDVRTPKPDNLIENRKKLVEVEFVINEKYYALRITDVGEGIDQSKVQLGRNRDILAPTGRGLFLIQHYTDCMVFTKQANPQKFSISMVKFME